ncbi:uncharacterized protein LOC144555809 [Carex rostrata]
MSSSMAGAVSKPLFFRDALLPYFNWRATNEGHEVPLVINISYKAASNGWQLLTPCTATGTNSIRKMRGWYSSCMFFSERPDFSLNLSCTGTPLSVNTYLSYTGTPLSANTADLRYTGTPLSVNTVISGYWMGPDDKDECGYVEALVQRIN